MLMSKDDFKKAFREAISSEFSQIPCDEDSIDFTFSERFNKKMSKLIKSQRKSYYFLINTASKRVAVVLVAILTLFSASMSIKAIREPVVKFIAEVYESFTRYFFEGETTDTISQECSIKVLPDGFEQTNKIKNDVIITTEYQDDSGNIIEFTQMTTENSAGYFVDNENSTIFTEYIDDVEVKFLEAYDMKQAIWAKESYVFNITCYGNFSFDAIKQIIRSVE